jgi:LacI family transcriptional regulator
MRVSLVDVAARAGVSPGTVSHVLNGNTAARIAPATQERVRQVAEEMGYRPNIFARSLLGKQTRTLGLLIAGLENPFYVGIAKALEKAVRDAEYQLLLYATMNEPGIYPEYKNSSTWPVDGVFVWSRGGIDPARNLGAQARSLPTVYLGYEGAEPRNYVAFDLYGGARTIMEHLVERGYRKIAYVLPEGSTGGPPTERRTRAYSEVCEAAGIQPEHIRLEDGAISTLAGLHAGQAVAARPAEQRPDALYCYNDAIAIGVVQGLRRAGLRVPEDIAVTGFDGVEFSQCLDTPLTTVLSPAEPLASAAVDILLRKLAADQESEPEGITISTQLIIGKTTR